MVKSKVVQNQNHENFGYFDTAKINLLGRKLGLTFYRAAVVKKNPQSDTR